MASSRDLKNRINSVTNTKKITRTMELVATAKSKKAVDRVRAAQPYANKIKELMSDLGSMDISFSHPLLRKPTETKKVGLLLINSNRGLCGGFNNHLIKIALDRLNEFKEKNIEVELHIVGKKGLSFFDFQKIPYAKSYTEFDETVTFADTEEISNYFLENFINESFDLIEVVSYDYITSSKQEAKLKQILPLQNDDSQNESEESGNTSASTSTGSVTERKEINARSGIIFERDVKTILSSLLPAAIKNQYFQALLESSASEQIARRIAMQNATDAAGDMIKEMNLKYNRARQSKITQEIAEIVGGALAIS